jgi:hypothetical protein
MFIDAAAADSGIAWPAYVYFGLSVFFRPVVGPQINSVKQAFSPDRETVELLPSARHNFIAGLFFGQ